MFVRYLLSHLLVGCVGGLVATAGLIATDVGSLGELMQHSEGGWLAAALLRLRPAEPMRVPVPPDLDSVPRLRAAGLALPLCWPRRLLLNCIQPPTTELHLQLIT